MKVFFVIIFFFLSGMCLCQNFNWKRLTEERLFVVDYIDTSNIDTVNSLIFFYIKQEFPDPEFHKRNLYHPDSIYTLYSANLEKPELTAHFKISFYKDGSIKFTPVSFRFGCNLMNYGYGNIIFVGYYYLVTSKNLLDCEK